MPGIGKPVMVKFLYLFPFCTIRSGNCLNATGRRGPAQGGGMYLWGLGLVKRRVSRFALSLLFGFLVLAFSLADSRSASALPTPSIKVHALPAFARKYGMPCSSCHQAWPMLSPFGQAFKDNGYQLGNERDAPIYQNPAYWPVTFRITPIWHRDNTNRAQVDGAAGVGGNEASGTTHGFDGPRL